MSVETPTWDKIINAFGSSTTEIGGSWANLISDYYNGIDIGLIDVSKKPIIGTLTRYKHEKLALYDIDQSHTIIFSADDIDTGTTRKVKFRRMNSPYIEDYAVLEGLPQAILNKDIDGDLNNIFDLGNSAIKAGANISPSKIQPGSDGQVIKTVSGTATWAADSGGGEGSTTTNRGYHYYIYHNGSEYQALNGKTGEVDYTHTTDFANVFNSAITAVSTAGGGLILLSAGTLLTRSMIVPKNNVRVVGQGEATIIKQDTTQNLAAIFKSFNFDSL